MATFGLPVIQVAEPPPPPPRTPLSFLTIFNEHLRFVEQHAMWY